MTTPKNDYLLGWNLINQFKETENPIDDPNFARIYSSKNNNWQTIGYRCIKCNKHFSRTMTILKHRNSCPALMINTLQEDDEMPIMKTSKGWYWGSKGPFPTREKAEQVAQAAYSSGYREKKEEKKDKR